MTELCAEQPQAWPHCQGLGIFLLLLLPFLQACAALKQPSPILKALAPLLAEHRAQPLLSHTRASECASYSRSVPQNALLAVAPCLSMRLLQQPSARTTAGQVFFRSPLSSRDIHLSPPSGSRSAEQEAGQREPSGLTCTR